MFPWQEKICLWKPINLCPLKSCVISLLLWCLQNPFYWQSEPRVCYTLYWPSSFLCGLFLPAWFTISPSCTSLYLRSPLFRTGTRFIWSSRHFQGYTNSGNDSIWQEKAWYADELFIKHSSGIFATAIMWWIHSNLLECQSNTQIHDQNLFHNN